MTGDRVRELDAELAVLGAGPAGLAAAVTAADAGCRVTVLDLGERIGGQYWRHPAAGFEAGPHGLHHGRKTFARLAARFTAHVRADRIDHRPGHGVWRIDRDRGFLVRATASERDPTTVTVCARATIVATGAYDRHVPFRGWTLPGVVAIGGAQSLLKGSLVTPGRRIVVAGTGPFLLSAADGLLRAGAEVPAIVEASRLTGYLRAPQAVAAAPQKLREAAGYAVTLARHRVPYLTGHAVVEARGEDRVSAVRVSDLERDWTPRGPERVIACDTLAVGFGFVPQLELLTQLECATRIDCTGMLVVEVDAEQRTSVAGVFAAGEPTGVGGADLAVAEGTLAGDAAAAGLGRRGALDDRSRTVLRRRRSRLRAFAELLAVAHPVRDGWRAWTDGTTQVCRCEEVTVDEIGAAVGLGARDARAVKLLARPGMGWCQGRVCGPAVASLSAALNGRGPRADDLRGLAERPLAQPVALGALADAAVSKRHPMAE
jgi:thioredoxin reductase